MRSDVAERVGELLGALLDDRSGAPAAVRSVTPVTEGWSARHGVRLPKLLARDDPHPLGFSRRGQLLDTLQVAVDASAASGALPGLRAWFEQTIAALRHRWPHLPPSQAVYPAYR